METKGGYYLIIQMQKTVFDSLPIEAIGHACFEPMVPVYQNGMHQQGSQGVKEYRSEFYKSLTQGQRALFMFFTYYDHAIRSLDEFQRISNHYLSAQIFSAVKKGVEYFNDDDMLCFLSKIEQAFVGMNQNDIQTSHINKLFSQLQETAPNTLLRIGAYIKESPDEFISFEIADI